MHLRERLYLQDQIPEASLAPGQEPPYYRPPEDSDEYRYMMDRRTALDGAVPRRVVTVKRKLDLPEADVFGEFDAGFGQARGLDDDGVHAAAAQPRS